MKDLKIDFKFLVIIEDSRRLNLKWNNKRKQQKRSC